MKSLRRQCIVCKFSFVVTGRGRGKHEYYCSRCYFLLRDLTGRDLNREKIRILDNHTCRSCGLKWEPGARRFDIHHQHGLCGTKSRGYDKTALSQRIMTKRKGLITLCHRCHMTKHVTSSRANGKLERTDLDTLRARIATGETYDSIARELRVSQAALYKKLNGRTSKLSTPR